MTDFATRTRSWLDGTVTPGPNRAWVVDARWTGIGGKVFVLPDDAARAAYLAMATRHASRAGRGRVARHLLSAIGGTLAAALLLTIGMAGSLPVDPGGPLLAMAALLVLGSALRAWSARNAAELQAWLRDASAESSADLHRAPATRPPGPRSCLVLLLDLVAIGLQIATATALTGYVTACAGWLPVAVALCTTPWLIELLPMVCWAVAGWSIRDAWTRH